MVQAMRRLGGVAVRRGGIAWRTELEVRGGEAVRRASALRTLGGYRGETRRFLGSTSQKCLFTSLNPFCVSEDSNVLESKEFSERRLVNFPTEQVYDVVRNVNDYKEFVPWCTDSKIIKSDGDNFHAKLGVGFQLLSEHYTSYVTIVPMKSVKAEVENNNLFNFLVNEWSFSEGPRQGTTWLNFFITFQFKNQTYQNLSSIFFDQVASKMVHAFEQRLIEQNSKRLRQAV